MATSMDKFNQFFEWECGRETRKDGTFDPPDPYMLKLDELLCELIGTGHANAKFSIINGTGVPERQLAERIKNVMRSAWTGGYCHGQESTQAGLLLAESLPVLRAVIEFCQIAGTPGIRQLTGELLTRIEAFGRSNSRGSAADVPEWRSARHWMMPPPPWRR